MILIFSRFFMLNLGFFMPVSPPDPFSPFPSRPADRGAVGFCGRDLARSRSVRPCRLPVTDLGFRLPDFFASTLCYCAAVFPLVFATVCEKKVLFKKSDHLYLKETIFSCVKLLIFTVCVSEIN